MKKYFFKEDGTIKVLNMVILLSIIFIIVMAIIYFKFLKVRYEEPNETYKKEEKTSSINICKDCDFSFTLDSLSFTTYHDYKLNSYLELKNMSINNLKFEGYDETLISIQTMGNDLSIKTLNKVGKTKLVASYASIRREIDIEVTPDEIHSIELADHPYYVYNNKENDLEIITDPLGLDINSINVSIGNDKIARIENGKIIGIEEGITKIKLVYNGKETSQDLYVYNDLIHINLPRVEEELYDIKLSDFKNDIMNIVVTLDNTTDKPSSPSDIVITHEDNGITPIVEYDGKYSLDKISYKYRITKTGDTGSSVITFTLGNTTRILRIGE